MNPFALPGPEFLLLFAILALAVIAVCWWRVRRHGDGPPPPIRELTQDPYRIAYLRGGTSEVLRVAIFNLVDRGLIAYDTRTLRVQRADAADFLTRPLDKAIVSHCRQAVEVEQAIRSPALRAAARVYDQALGARGLVPDEAENAARKRFGGAAIGLLAGVALVKVVLALSQGHRNVELLFIIPVFAVAGVATACRWQPTRAGRQAVASLQQLMTRLQHSAPRLRPGGVTNEALMLAAVYGLDALPRGVFPIAKHLRRTRTEDAGGSGSGSSSCGNCCGGGCGGCGGCGSD
jgi:uncharacterized protein (TIGR04222 family)